MQFIFCILAVAKLTDKAEQRNEPLYIRLDSTGGTSTARL